VVEGGRIGAVEDSGFDTLAGDFVSGRRIEGCEEQEERCFE